MAFKLQLIVLYVDAISIKLFRVLEQVFSRVCNRKDRCAITHALSDALRSSLDTFNFFVGINFRRKAVSRNLFLRRKASSNYPKINFLRQ